MKPFYKGKKPQSTPSPPGLKLNTIPGELKEQKRWVNWRKVQRGGKLTKVPINPSNGEQARSNGPVTWGTDSQAVKRFKKGDVDGIGFVLGDGYVGIDLDDCRNPATGEIESRAWEIIRDIDSYAEVSPSGTGIHILARGILPAGRRRKGHIEIYSSGRYFTVTGWHLKGSPSTIEERSDAIRRLHQQAFSEAQAKGTTSCRTDSVANVETDAELIERARRAANGAKFERLWAGDRSGYDSQSEADLALCMILAFWTGRDAARIDALFRQSGLFRDKWDERHGADGRTYGQITMDNAIQQTRDVYRAEGRRRHTGRKTAQTGQHLALIVVNNRQLRNVTTEALEALQHGNDPPSFFVRMGSMVRVRMDEKERPIVDTVGELELQSRIARVASYVRISKGKQVECAPPRDLVRDILGLGSWSLPPLEGIVEAPILRPGGTVLDRPGYDPSTHLFYAPADGLKVPAIPIKPTAEEVADALAFLNEAISEFPYVDEASRANTFGLLLTPVGEASHLRPNSFGVH